MENNLAAKLHPSRFPNMSGKMAAIVGHVLGEQWTDPEIAELHITSDGAVLARHDGDCGCNDFIGDVADLECNIHNLLAVAGLGEREKYRFMILYHSRIVDWRRQT